MNYFPDSLKNIESLKASSLKNLLHQSDFKRGAMIVSGGYAKQDFYSIMASKLYDIQHKGFCFWAHRYIIRPEALKFSSDFLDYEGEKYLIMTYTNMNKYYIDNSLSMQVGESIDDYYTRMKSKLDYILSLAYAKRYKYCNNNIWEDYPDDMFPEIVFSNKNCGAAYCVSDFSYLTEDISLRDMCALFNQNTITKGWSNVCNYYKRPNHTMIELKNPEELVLSSDIKKTDQITYILAKLKYPYIAQLQW